MLMPVAHIVLLIQDESGASLYRYASDGAKAGSTWHESVDDAMHQASFEYGDALGAWEQIPTEELDPKAFVRDKLA